MQRTQSGESSLLGKFRHQLASRSVVADDRLAFAVLSGSFNPVHIQHVSIMDRSREELERQGWRVLGGFLAPSSGDYVSQKLGAHAMSLQERVHLCHVATASSDWIGVCEWGEFSSYRLTNRLRTHLMAESEGTTIVGIEIMGADTLTRLMKRLIGEWGEVSQGAREPWYQDRHILCVNRGGPHAEAECTYVREFVAPRAAEFGVRILTEATPGPHHPPSDISSTSIRELIDQADWAALEDRGWLDAGVLHMLEAWRAGRGDVC